MKTLICSDIHADYNALCHVFEVAEQEKIDRLIFGGDTGDFWRFNREKNIELFFDIFSDHYMLEIILNKKVELVILLGNHDFELYMELYKEPQLMEYVKYISDNYMFEDVGKKFLVLHGHQAEYEAYDLNSSFFKKILVRIYAYTLGKRFPMLATRAEELSLAILCRLEHTELDENYRKFAEKIRTYMKADVVFMGHTHRKFSSDTYVNTGWGEKGEMVIVEDVKITFI